MPPTLPLSDRMAAHTVVTEGCWTTTYHPGPKGYAYVRLRNPRRSVRAHRVAWELANGPIPDGFHVLHHCDNPPCVRLDHLFLGTDADNSVDKIAKGRDWHATGDRHGSRTHPERLARGERHGSRTHPERVPRGDRNGRRTHPERGPRAIGARNGQAKLTEEQVLDIRKRVAAGEMQKDLAAQYDVSKSTVNLIILRRNWPHL